ncbi:hypothetical protein MRB53_000016 [Persea americana]|uniref:Uncharacterized protein n=1 Tax=Persea americana TaxID=3435 RepID=A0ACC2MNP2_PERAE|nr:hypothetical protein MRB53_000016 [Persea americana]
MENTSRNTCSSTPSFVDLVGVAFFYAILIWVNRFQFLYSKIQTILAKPNPNEKTTKNMPSHQLCLNDNINNNDDHVVMLSKKDKETVMEKMGLPCSRDDGNQSTVVECLGESEFSDLFEEMEPSLEEVKEAFDVFDANRDGFIDARELQRVLRDLGFREASKLEACEKMIGAFDKRGKGRIDFYEFFKLMENSFE